MKTTREINGHRCSGVVIVVEVEPQEHVGEAERAARIKAAMVKGSDYRTWEAVQIAPGKFECFVCAHEDVYALND